MFVWDKDDLNEEQVEAINEPGNVFLAACPGSGKTRTLIYRIAKQLSELKSEKHRVFAITYTRRAADEIHERIERLGIDTSQLWIGTIHSFCLEWILRPYAGFHEELKLGFRVTNSHETEAVLEGLIGQRYPSLTIFDCGYYVTSSGYHLTCSDASKAGALQRLLGEYWALLQQNRQLDFELILYFAYQLISTVPVISKLLASIFKAILVDEYQDTREIQYFIIASILRQSGTSTTAFIVGDPNQAIFGSLGGYAISPAEFGEMSGLPFRQMKLSSNYRSSKKIVGYFEDFSSPTVNVEAVGKERDYPSIISYNDKVRKDDLQAELVRLIRLTIEEKKISPSEVCIIAPWWTHLASAARQLMTAMPEYTFDGPGMAPFARDPDNFWFKLSRILLTTPSPSLFIKRRRWAGEVIDALRSAGINVAGTDQRELLMICNKVTCSEQDGLTYLRQAFSQVFDALAVDHTQNASLQEHHDAFFDSAQRRIARLVKEGSVAISNIAMFRKVFSERSGITVSSIHGVKGAEFDVVIAYGLLDGMVPHFTDADQDDSARKLLYVICSRARKNLYLISETGRAKGRRGTYSPSPLLANRQFAYDVDPQ
ncbi:UvrD-helicase domain-containing protein [Rhizobium ruizarguesonis]|uniref:UvrD-helicase domain-containing protein n=1 Tax=Rhizobium ruizarguesonis TaxID=2081791 RepID=UPI001039748B|nr:ATP-dependent helicase [Rhizobium ruizarguesonis]NEH37245.1 AAA family ATPase [Rhizobium ruizarguesonis]NEJ32667.1 AAA family ATPase [Rhizobium ruizarguesonis]TBY89585.1 ATP-dependent helicase [Rhizobium leguminosarum bv. viciae]TCB46624.1 ATP-dependent helicase [Rhizobium leguminosarum bv. viciae]